MNIKKLFVLLAFFMLLGGVFALVDTGNDGDVVATGSSSQEEVAVVSEPTIDYEGRLAALEKKYYSLQSSYDELSNKYGSLLDDYGSLQKKYETVSSSGAAGGGSGSSSGEVITVEETSFNAWTWENRKYCMYGDTNNDGKLNSEDYEYIKSIVNGEIKAPWDLSCLDMNLNFLDGDGKITQFDVDMVGKLLDRDNDRCRLGDTNEDGRIDKEDYSYIWSFVYGKEELPVDTYCLNVYQQGLQSEGIDALDHSYLGRIINWWGDDRKQEVVDDVEEPLNYTEVEEVEESLNYTEVEEDVNTCSKYNNDYQNFWCSTKEGYINECRGEGEINYKTSCSNSNVKEGYCVTCGEKPEIETVCSRESRGEIGYPIETCYKGQEEISKVKIICSDFIDEKKCLSYKDFCEPAYSKSWFRNRFVSCMQIETEKVEVVEKVLVKPLAITKRSRS